MTDQPTHTIATDEATASVRPADARYNRTRFTPEQLAEIREQEIEEATVRLLEQRKAEEEKNLEAAEASGYVNPTLSQEETPTSRAFEKVYGKGSGEADQTPADQPPADQPPADQPPADSTRAAKAAPAKK